MEDDVNKEHSNIDPTEIVDAIERLYKNNNLHKSFIERFLLWIIPKVEKIAKKMSSNHSRNFLKGMSTHGSQTNKDCSLKKNYVKI